MIDACDDAVTFCNKNYHGSVQQAVIQNLPFKDNIFDFIFSLEVIEHIRDDLSVMKELCRVLKPGGFLIITVPAFMCLWGFHDEKGGHLRRYSKSDFIQLSKKAGFKILTCSYFKTILFLPLLFLRHIKEICRHKSDDFYAVAPILNKLLHILLKIETRVISLWGAPVGSSLIVVLAK
jgi:SAM-dependent methyltransferase